MANKFSQKLLSFSFSLAQGNFGDGGNSATILTTPPQGQYQGLRASCRIEILGGERTSSTLEAAIYGLPMSLMNQLTILPGIYGAQGSDHLTVLAGDADGMTTVFSGDIYSAFMDGSAQPHVPFRVVGRPDALSNYKPYQPTSVAGSTDVAQLMQKLAGDAGWAFENNSVNVKVSNPYLPGPLRVQVEHLARMANIRALVDKGTLAIWNAGQGRAGGGAIISAQTGMVGYPVFALPQIVVKTVFDPAIEYGKIVTVQSDIPAACGQWEVAKQLLELESFMPKGKWFTTIWGNKVGAPQVPH